MTNYAIPGIMAAVLLALPTIAMSNDQLAVLAVDRSTGSMTMGDVVAYTKTFDLSLTNTSDSAVDLAETCLFAQTTSGERFGLDTVDEVLISGSLNAGDIVTGSASFGSDNDMVLEVTSVHVSDNC
ncbi:DUF4354 family protein [Roseinatronobacter sp. S2]|uniref:DUF4354 family protein n=1 Tax=Roseinatronobacter sp. S2 TaxID=3035471 RepID=UPI0024103F01|nr:DUF4354 family protein [Roseinatronobacter sp. S2]WFE75765.1 DUF4354 family protein [Roseinatronobacter sp. S2]